MMDCMPQIHVAAIHAHGEEYRTFVPGAAILCVRDQTDIVSAGAFSNSVGETSKYAVAGTYFGQLGSLRFGMVGGVIDGYPANGKQFMPMLAAVASLPVWGQTTLHLTLVPPANKDSPALVQLSFSFK